MLPPGPGAAANHTAALVETGCTVPAAVTPTTLHEPVQARPSSPGQAPGKGQRAGRALEPGRTVLRMLSMDPLGDAHILISVQNGCQRDLFTMFFCSSLSCTEREEYDGKTPPGDIDPTPPPHLTLQQAHPNLTTSLLMLCSDRVACWVTLTFGHRKQIFFLPFLFFSSFSGFREATPTVQAFIGRIGLAPHTGGLTTTDTHTHRQINTHTNTSSTRLL